MKNVVAGAAVFVGLVLCFANTANAAPVLYCKDGPGIDLVADGCISGTSKFYPSGGDGVYSNTGGGDPEAAVEAAILGATGVAVDIMLYGEAPNALFNTTGFFGNSGTWDVVDNSIAIAYITIKAANSFALFDVQGANSGTWSTAGMLTNGGAQPGVSHIRAWKASVPEPGTFGLLGLGVVALWLRRRA